MDSIKEKLCQLADHNKGSFKTTCTLSLKSDEMDINIEADSLEEAYNKLEAIVENKNSESESKEEVVIPEKEAAQPAPTPAPAVESANYNASNKVDSPELYDHIEKDVVSQYYMKYADK